MNAARKVVLQHPAVKRMLEATIELDKIKDSPEKVGQLVSNARSLVHSSIDLIRETDPMLQKFGMICMMFLESTSYSMQKVEGQLQEVAQIDDEYLFACAVRLAHGLPAQFKSKH